jgi:hypothetical protein
MGTDEPPAADRPPVEPPAGTAWPDWASPQPRSRVRTIGLFAAAGIIVLAIIGVGVVLLTRTAFNSVSTFTMHGGVSGNCSKLRIWGGQVTVYDDTGRIVGAGPLTDAQTASQGCVYSFTIANVPSSSKTYGIEIGRLGRINIDHSQAQYPDLTVK